MTGPSDMPIPDDPVPAVSVIMAVYNGARYLEEALYSIQAQSLREIEIIVVDDASTDETPQILARAAVTDPRLRVVSQPVNSGSGAARNRAISLARAPLIAVMDADDVAAPDRLMRQKAWMDRHPEVVLLAGSMRQIDAEGRVIRTSIRGRDAAATRWMARFNMPLIHPTVMFRRSAPDQPALFYDPTLRVAQDYDLVSRALDLGDVVALPDVLVDYRVHGTSITGTRWRDQQRVASGISLRRLQADLPAPIVEALAPFRKAYFEMKPVAPDALFDGLRRMLDHDARIAPGHQAWMRRQAAQLAATALQRSGAGKRGILQAFLRSGRDSLSPLTFRYLETRRWLPKALSTDLNGG